MNIPLWLQKERDGFIGSRCDNWHIGWAYGFNKACMLLIAENQRLTTLQTDILREVQKNRLAEITKKPRAET